MICDVCHGDGIIWKRARSGKYQPTGQCPECHGSGVTNCGRGHQPTDRDKEIEQVRDD